MKRVWALAGLWCVVVAGLVVAAPGVGSAASAVVPGAPSGVSVAGAVSGVRVSWVAPASDGGSPLLGFVVTPSVGSAVEVDASVTEVVVPADPGQSVSVSVVARNAVGSSAAVAVGPAVATAAGGLVRVTSPQRLVDSRYGTGVVKGKLAARVERVVQVTGRAGVPASGVASVFVNVMALDVDAATSLTVFPDGGSAPATSSVEARAGERLIQAVQVRVGSGGRIRLRNGAGATNAVLDVLGYSLTSSAAGASTNGVVTATAPTEVLNTRTGVGAPKARLGEKRYVDATVLGRAGVPASGVAAVVVNLTAYNPSTITGITVYPSGPLPGTQNLSAVPGVNRTNRVLVKPGAGGKVRVYNQWGAVDVKLDVAGWVSDGTAVAPAGESFNAQDPARVADTRTGTGLAKAPLAKGAEATVTVAGRGGVPAMSSSMPPSAVLAFVRIVTTTPTSSVALRAAGTPWASVADVTGRGGQTMGNLVVVPLSADGRITMRSSPGSSGPIDVVVDVVGWFGGSVVIAPDVRALSAAETAGVTNVTASGFELPAGVAAPKVGAVLTAPPSAKLTKGMLRRVTAVTAKAGGGWTVTTRQAGLREAIRSGKLTAALDTDGPATVVRPGDTTGAGAAPNIGVEVGVERSFTYEPVAGVSVEGSLSASASADLTVDVGFFDVDATVEASASQAISGSASTSFAAEWSGQVDLGEYSFVTYYFQIGPVPIVVQPQIELSAEASGKAEGSLSVGFDQATSGTVGVTYDDGNLDPFQSFTNTPPSFTGPTLDAQATARVALVANLELEFYGAAEFGVGLVGGLQLDTTPCGVKLDATLDARLSVDIEIFGIDVGETSVDLRLGTWPLTELEIPGLCPIWTGTVKVTGGLTYVYAGSEFDTTNSYSYDQTWRWTGGTGGGLQGLRVTDSTTTTARPGYCNMAYTGTWVTTVTGDANTESYAGITYGTDSGGAKRWFVSATPATGGGTYTHTFCGESTSGPAAIGTNNFAQVFNDAFADAPGDDPYTLDATRTLSASEACEVLGACTAYSKTGSVTMTVKMTKRPDANFDGVPD